MAEMPVKDSQLYFNDTAALDGSFGVAAAGDRVARILLDVETPFTLGVTGKWGSGKTSVLRRAFASLKGQQIRVEVPFAEQPKIEEVAWNEWSYDNEHRKVPLKLTADRKLRASQSLCVWYSPWQHQAANNPVLPLLTEIKKQYSWKANALGLQGDQVRKGLLAGLTLLERVIDGALVLHGGKGVATGTTAAVRKAWQESGNPLEALDDGQRFQLVFQDAIETALDGLRDQNAEEADSRLIVFVDDLDRCEESVVVELLEAIKLYLGSPRCVFVLGIDEFAVLKALDRHWKGRSEDFNRDYLQKLFQMTLAVPAPQPEKMAPDVEALLKRHGWVGTEEVAQMILRLLEPNPRRVKNFVNALCASWSLLSPIRNSEDAPQDQRRFVLLHYLRSSHPAVWRLLERQPWSLRILHQVIQGRTSAVDYLPDGVDPAEQRLVERLMFRAFAHVLSGASDDAEKDDRHDFLSLADAVQLANERIDRKRSDEFFVQIFRDSFAPNDDVPQWALYLLEPEDLDE